MCRFLPVARRLWGPRESASMRSRRFTKRPCACVRNSAQPRAGGRNAEQLVLFENRLRRNAHAHTPRARTRLSRTCGEPARTARTLPGPGVGRYVRGVTHVGCSGAWLRPRLCGTSLCSSVSAPLHTQRLRACLQRTDAPFYRGHVRGGADRGTGEDQMRPRLCAEAAPCRVRPSYVLCSLLSTCHCQPLRLSRPGRVALCPSGAGLRVLAGSRSAGSRLLRGVRSGLLPAFTGSPALL